MFDYFYGAQSDQFSFYRVPKVMFTDPAFQNVSAEAKILYGLFLDRMGLSARNNWVDEQGRVYIIYTIDQILQLRGVRPFLSDKYDLTQHPNFKYTADSDKKLTFDIEKFLDTRAKLKASDEFLVVDAEG